MNRNTQIVLAIVVAVLLILCLCTCASALLANWFIRNSSVTFGPYQVERAAREAVLVEPAGSDENPEQIAGFTLPNGWRSDYAFKAAGFRIVGYAPVTGVGHIMLALLPETVHVDLGQLVEEIHGLARSPGHDGVQEEMNVVQRKPVTIRGQATEMIISEGRGSSGAWRQAMATFYSDRGLALVIFGMPAAAYDQATVDAFFLSIR